MILRITNTPYEDIPLNHLVMPIPEFVDIRNHPWLASHDFEAVVIDLDESIPIGYLRNMVGKFLVVPVITGEINSSVIRMLSELYPEEVANLRFSFLRDKAKVPEIIEGLKKAHEWEKYY